MEIFPVVFPLFFIYLFFWKKARPSYEYNFYDTQNDSIDANLGKLEHDVEVERNKTQGQTNSLEKKKKIKFYGYKSFQ